MMCIYVYLFIQSECLSLYECFKVMVRVNRVSVRTRVGVRMPVPQELYG